MKTAPAITAAKNPRRLSMSTSVKSIKAFILAAKFVVACGTVEIIFTITANLSTTHCSESVLVPLAQHEVGNFRATGIAPALISRRITGTPLAVGVSMAVNAPATVDAPAAVAVLVAVEDSEVIDVDAYVPRPSVIVTNPFNTTPRQLAAPVSRPILPDSVTSSSVIQPDSIPIPPPLPVVASSLLNIVPPRLHTDLQVLLMRLLTYVFVLPSVT